MSIQSCDPWVRAGLDAWSLAAEASTVIALRMVRLAAGGTASVREANLMITEKVEAGLELQASLVGKGFSLTLLAGAQTTLRHYRRKVAANRRRLAR